MIWLKGYITAQTALSIICVATKETVILAAPIEKALEQVDAVPVNHVWSPFTATTPDGNTSFVFTENDSNITRGEN